MARVTRSRKIEIAEDTTAFAIDNSLLPKIPSALVDITAHPGTNAMPTFEEDEVATELKGLKKAYRSILGGGKGKKAKQSKKEKQQSITDVDVQDVVAGGQDGIITTNGSLNGNTDQVVEEHIGSAEEQPPSQRALRPRNKKGVASTVDAEQSKVESAIIAPSANGDDKSEKEDEDKGTESLLVKLTPTTLDEVEKACEGENVAKPTSAIDHPFTEDDSFIEQIMSRSPAKPVSRIEDSVEALDELEEVLEALDQVAMAEHTLSSGVSKKIPPRPTKDLKNAKHQTLEQYGTISQLIAKNSKKPATLVRHGSMLVKSTEPKQNTAVKRSKSVMIKENDVSHTLRETPTPDSEISSQGTRRTGVKRPTSLLPPKPPVKSTKPATIPTFELPGEAVARKLKEQREARLAQRSSEQSPPKPVITSTPKVKSTKPPTKPAFELPGEAISRKKREALEARLKAEEEEERKRREFKAKPILNPVPSHVPRETITSRARQSKIGTENSDYDGSVSPKQSGTGTHRLSVANLAQANMATSRAPGPTPTLSRKTSSIASVPRTLSETEVQIQRQRAKEIYDRDAKYTEDHDRERKEREAIAKRSREEAAERGRQASREWAEKQRAKKLLEAEKRKEGQMGSKP